MSLLVTKEIDLIGTFRFHAEFALAVDSSPSPDRRAAAADRGRADEGGRRAFDLAADKRRDEGAARFGRRLRA